MHMYLYKRVIAYLCSSFGAAFEGANSRHNNIVSIKHFENGLAKWLCDHTHDNDVYIRMYAIGDHHVVRGI